MRERGAVSILAAAVIALIIFTGVLGLGAGRILIGVHQAQLAADASALAAARASFASLDPSREAATLAGANGAELLACDCRVDRTLAIRTAKVLVAVHVDAGLIGVRVVRAAAAAEFDPGGG